MIRKSGYRFSEKIMLKQKAKAGQRFNQKSSRSKNAVGRAGKSPAIAQRAGAAVGLRAWSEFAVEFCDRRPVRGQMQFGCGGCERGILRRRYAVHDEVRSRQT